MLIASLYLCNVTAKEIPPALICFSLSAFCTQAMKSKTQAIHLHHVRRVYTETLYCLCGANAHGVGVQSMSGDSHNVLPMSICAVCTLVASGKWLWVIWLGGTFQDTSEHTLVNLDVSVIVNGRSCYLHTRRYCVHVWLRKFLNVGLRLWFGSRHLFVYENMWAKSNLLFEW